MIGLSRLKRAIAGVPTGGMQTGDLKVQLKLCDAQRIEVEYAAIISERDAALAQSAELVAQLVAIQDAALKPQGRTRQQWIDNIKRNVLGITAREHLRQIQADAGRAGFIDGAEYFIDPDKVNLASVAAAADLYAARVKAGEVK